MNQPAPITDLAEPRRLRLLLEAQRSAFHAEGLVALATRVDRIERCLRLLRAQQEKICAALHEDFGSRSRHVSLMTDLYPSVSALKHVRKNLSRWMKPQKRRVQPPLGLFGVRARVLYQPKGVVGLMTPWNVPVSMIFTPLADILGAGNRCMIKPSEFTPHTSALLAELLGQAFDSSEICVVSGDAETGAAFSALPFDHLVFTGSGAVGSRVMRAAAAQLTPVTLELGGKSPVLLGESAPLEDSVDKIMAGKCLNAGQLCVAPDYVLLPAGLMEAFISRARHSIHSWFPTLKDNPDYVALLNERHQQRLLDCLEDAAAHGARIEVLNPAVEELRESSCHKLAPTLVIDPPEEARIMQEEIFGPLLVLRGCRNMDEAIAFVNRRPRPLALYYFGRDKKEERKVLSHTIAGGVTINDVAMHVGCNDLPFGGSGASGMGSYHGMEGFRSFSHAKAVYRQGFINFAAQAGTLPPYGEKLEKLMRSQIGEL